MIISTKTGKYQGSFTNGVYAFKGIPFAKAPIHDLRFKPPVPIQKHEGILDATKWKTKAIQNHDPLDSVKVSEDCLYLNIWTKDLTITHKPVVVWIHGGGFTSGSGADEMFNGEHFSHSGEVIFITLNYRLGVFGFLDVSPILGPDYKGSANNGILDLIEALRWISENIEHFGGDPKQITVMGESAGAKCVATLLTIPSARNLIAQAILQSGSVQCIRDEQTSQLVTSLFMNQLPPNVDLLTYPALDLLDAQLKISTVSMGQLHLFGPVIDYTIIEDEPFTMISKNKNMPLKILMGYNQNEAALFLDHNLPLQNKELDCLEGLFGVNTNYLLNHMDSTWEKTLTKYLYKNATLQLACKLVEAGHDVYVYRLDWGKEKLGACHAQDLALVFDLKFSHDELHQLPDDAFPLAAKVHNCWKKFMLGNPPQVDWPLFNKGSYMVLNHQWYQDVIKENEIDWNFPIQVYKK